MDVLQKDELFNKHKGELKVVYWQALERAYSKQTLSNGVNIPNSSHLTICLRTFHCKQIHAFVFHITNNFVNQFVLFKQSL
jgi:hypothetical protein